MTTRRRLLIAFGVAALSPRTALPQAKQPIVVGWLNSGVSETQAPHFTAFKTALAESGWSPGGQVIIEERWANGHVASLPALAAELKAKKPALIVSAPGTATIAAAKAAPDVPIVQATGTSPVAFGLAASLARPGGLVTGVTNIGPEISEKYLELLLAAVPGLKRVGFLIESTSVNRALYVDRAARVAKQHAIEARIGEVSAPTELRHVIARLAKEGAQALIVTPSNWFTHERRTIVNLAFERRWPVVHGDPLFAEAGALITYGVDQVSNYRRAASYVDRILKGARPGDLPIEQPTKFDLLINRKTAQALGIAIPPELLVRADKVIE